MAPSASIAPCWTPGGVPSAAAIEAEDAIAGYVSGRRSKHGEAIINAGAVRITDAGEQVPESERVILTSVSEENAEQGSAFNRRVKLEVEVAQNVAKRCASIFHLQGARAD